MYDELVKQLRDNAEFLVKASSGCLSNSFADTMCQAADAIERLSEYADTIGRLKCEGWYLQQTKFHDGYQAIATMPLPEPPKEET